MNPTVLAKFLTIISSVSAVTKKIQYKKATLKFGYSNPDEVTYTLIDQMQTSSVQCCVLSLFLFFTDMTPLTAAALSTLPFLQFLLKIVLDAGSYASLFSKSFVVMEAIYIIVITAAFCGVVLVPEPMLWAEYLIRGMMYGGLVFGVFNIFQAKQSLKSWKVESKYINKNNLCAARSMGGVLVMTSVLGLLALDGMETTPALGYAMASELASLLISRFGYNDVKNVGLDKTAVNIWTGLFAVAVPILLL